MIESLGKHMLAEYYSCDRLLINDMDFLREQLLVSAKIAGATVISSSFHPFSPHGISGIIVVKESHFAVHTWPEHGYAAVDFFTCSPQMNFETAYEFLAKKLKSSHSKFDIISRGDFSEINRGQLCHNHKEIIQ